MLGVGEGHQLRVGQPGAVVGGAFTDGEQQTGGGRVDVVRSRDDGVGVGVAAEGPEQDRPCPVPVGVVAEEEGRVDDVQGGVQVPAVEEVVGEPGQGRARRLSPPQGMDHLGE